MIDNFVIFIISHGRSDNIVTLKTLSRLGYNGPLKIVIDNLDKTADKYYELYGNDVVMFNKTEIAKTTDNGDNFENYRSTTHARNACFDIARDLGYTYFLVLDDDYTSFRFRFDQNLDYKNKMMNNTSFNKVLESLLDFYKKTPILSLAIGQGGDFIGGENSSLAEKVKTKRKAMNFFICSVERPFKFISRLNEDVNTYLNLGSRGFIFLTILQVGLDQKQTQTNAGGMSEAYLEGGTYVKTFYSIMYSPSSVKVSCMGNKNKRIHHKINWKKTVPKILSEKWRKATS